MGENKPEGATRITFSFWTNAPYTENEMDTLNSDLAGFVKEFDDDVVVGSFGIEFQDRKQIAEAKKRQIVEALNSAGPVIALQFPADGAGSWEYIFNEDNEND